MEWTCYLCKIQGKTNTEDETKCAYFFFRCEYKSARVRGIGGCRVRAISRCRLVPAGKKGRECTHETLTAVSHAPAVAIALEKQAGPSSTSTRANIASS
ncbi:MAG: hypothetical protein ACPIOQ_00930 [Promethearchaeia archaeon]